MSKPRVIAIHLLNDFSGSPFVFSQALQALQQDAYDVHLFTATPSGKGFLQGMQNIQIHSIIYRWSRHKLVTLFFFVYSQAVLFFRLLFFIRSGDVVYINSILPFGAALAAKARSAKLVYHIHEVSVKPLLLKRWLVWVVQVTATRCIYVSEYVKQHTAVNIRGDVVYNALPVSFTEKAQQTINAGDGPFIVLMLCSLKRYKGIDAFVESAAVLSYLRFELVLNATQNEIDHYFSDKKLTVNIILYPAQANVHPFYERASLVVNLSLPDQWIETFGMTVLEAMYYKKPVIVPPVGGIAELVTDGINGYFADSRNLNNVVEKIRQLAVNKSLHCTMSQAAYDNALKFTQHTFSLGVRENIAGLPDLNAQRLIHPYPKMN